MSAAALLAWLSGLDGAFQFDDFNVIVDNPAVHGWSAWWASMPGIRPLLKASYTANWTLGHAPLGFHLVNGALHLANALLVRRVVSRVLVRTGLPADLSQHSASWSAILFAVHPAQTEVVTYLSGRSVSLMSVFLLGTVLAHLVAWESAKPARWRAVGIVCLVAAFAAKENAWTLPLLVVVCERLAGGASWRECLRRTAGLWAVLALLGWVVLVIPGYSRLLGTSLGTRTLGANLLSQIDGLWYLVSRPLTGAVLNIDPDLRGRSGLAWDLTVKACVMLLVFGGLWRAGRTRPWLRLGLAWYAVMVAATNSVLPRTDIANDRALYLALVGVMWILVAGLSVGLSLRWAPWVVGVVALGFLVATTVRNRDYRTEVALWSATAAHSPGKARVWNNLGFAWERAGDPDRARAAYRRALEQDPSDVKARINLELLDGAR